MKPDYIFTLVKLINVENEYLLVRTSLFLNFRLPQQQIK